MAGHWTPAGSWPAARAVSDVTAGTARARWEAAGRVAARVAVVVAEPRPEAGRTDAPAGDARRAAPMGSERFLMGFGVKQTIRGLRGDARDERFQRIDIHATAFAGTVVIAAVIVGFLVEVAHSRDGNPYTWLGAVGGLAYLAAVIAMRLRG